MRTFLLGLCLVGALSAQAQSVTPVKVPEKAAVKLEKLLKQTEAVMAIGKRGSSLPAEARPVLNKILAQSTSDFLAITARQPTKEAYFQSVDASLARLNAMVAKQEDREQVAEYYQDLLDIVGLESSEGRLTAFVEGALTQR